MGPRRSIQAPRASLVWFLTSFAVVQLGVTVLVELRLPWLRDPPYKFKAVQLEQRLALARTRPLTVVLVGSSRALHGMRGTLLEDQLSRRLGQPVIAFNFGVPAAGPIRELLFVKRLLADGLRPDLLLIEVLPPFLAGQKQAPMEWQCIVPEELRPQELSLLHRYGLPSALCRRHWWQWKPVPFFSWRYGILSMMAPDWASVEAGRNWICATDDSGWMPNQVPESHRRALEHARKTYAPFLADFRPGGASCLAVRDLLSLCRSERIPAALVLMPEGTSFRNYYSPTAWVQILAYLDQLQREFAVPLINAREWVPDGAFGDGHHLLAPGAEMFSRRLGGEVLELLQNQAWGQEQGTLAQEMRIP